MVSPKAIFILFGMYYSMTISYDYHIYIISIIVVVICLLLLLLFVVVICLGVYGDVVRVKILYNKRDSALVQFKEPQQAQNGTLL